MIRLVGLHIQQQFLDNYATPLRDAGLEVAAHGIVSRFGALSSGYDGRTGLAKKHPTLRDFLGAYVPDWRDTDELVLCTWSAGTWAPEHWLKYDPEAMELIRVLVLLDGMHSSATSNDGFERFAKVAMREGERLFIATNTEIKPPYRSTSQAAAILLDDLGITNRTPSADGEQWRRGDDDGYARGVHVIDAATTESGGTATDHVWTVRALGPDLMGRIVLPWLQQRPERTTLVPEPDDMPTTPATPLLGERCVAWCRAQMAEDGTGKKPPASKLQKWFSFAERNGQVGYLGTKFVGNHCAISQCAAARECARPGEAIPHAMRSSAMELRSDAIASHCWHEASEVRSGKWFPRVGDLAIYTRAVPGRAETQWWGHVDRVTSVDAVAGTYGNIGANEVGGAWREQDSPFSNPKLLGFLAYNSGQKPVDLLNPHEVEAARELAQKAFSEAG